MIQKNVKLGDFICKKCQSSAKEYDKNNEKEFNLRTAMVVLKKPILILNLVYFYNTEKKIIREYLLNLYVFIFRYYIY
jgi:hypothetical protein